VSKEEVADTIVIMQTCSLRHAQCYLGLWLHATVWHSCVGARLLNLVHMAGESKLHTRSFGFGSSALLSSCIELQLRCMKLKSKWLPEPNIKMKGKATRASMRNFAAGGTMECESSCTIKNIFGSSRVTGSFVWTLFNYRFNAFVWMGKLHALPCRG